MRPLYASSPGHFMGLVTGVKAPIFLLFRHCERVYFERSNLLLSLQYTLMRGIALAGEHCLAMTV